MLDDPLAASQRLIVRTSLLEVDWPSAALSIRVSLDGGELAGRVAPLVDIHRSGSDGFTWVFYTNLAPLSLPPDRAVDSLRDLEFGRIIVPFYGNPHFVCERLNLRPFYQDRWLQAYTLDAP